MYLNSCSRMPSMSQAYQCLLIWVTAQRLVKLAVEDQSKSVSAPQPRRSQPVATREDFRRSGALTRGPPAQSEETPPSHSPQKAPLKPWPHRAGESLARPHAAEGNPGTLDAEGHGRTPQPDFPAPGTRGPAPNTVKPTPTSWNADDRHRTFRPMRRRHHSAEFSPW